MQTTALSLKRCLPLLLGATALLAQDPRIVIDNDQVKVLKVPMMPHAKTKLHQHKVNRVMIYLQAGKQDINYEGGKKTVLDFKPGQALWSPAAGMHIAEMTTNQPVTIVEVELKKPAGKAKQVISPMDPLKVDPKHYKVEFENDQVRVLRAKIGPHETAPMHEHSLNRVVTYITGQDFRVTSSDGKVDHVQHKAGDVSWGGPTKHKEENLSGEPFEVVVVEIKN